MTNKIILEENEFYTERYQLACERIKELNENLSNNTENLPSEELRDYFIKTSSFLIQIMNIYSLSESGQIRTLTLDEHKKLNEEFYNDIKDDNYNTSYANPLFAVEKLGEETG